MERSLTAPRLPRSRLVFTDISAIGRLAGASVVCLAGPSLLQSPRVARGVTATLGNLEDCG